MRALRVRVRLRVRASDSSEKIPIIQVCSQQQLLAEAEVDERKIQRNFRRSGDDDDPSGQDTQLWEPGARGVPQPTGLDPAADEEEPQDGRERWRRRTERRRWRYGAAVLAEAGATMPDEDHQLGLDPKTQHFVDVVVGIGRGDDARVRPVRRGFGPQEEGVSNGPLEEDLFSGSEKQEPHSTQ